MWFGQWDVRQVQAIEFEDRGESGTMCQAMFLGFATRALLIPILEEIGSIDSTHTTLAFD